MTSLRSSNIRRDARLADFYIFSEAEAVGYARGIKGLFPDTSKLAALEIGNGNLNRVFRISDSESGRSLILKQALPYVKVVGESVPLSLDRVRIESEALRLQREICPDITPNVYACEPDLALIAIEDLSDHIVMRSGLMKRERYPFAGDRIGSSLARMSFFTSDLFLDPQEKKMRAKAFVNPELCAITEDIVLDAPYRRTRMNRFDPRIRDAVERIWTDTELHLEVALLREKFLTAAQAMIHGDLHTDNIFLKHDSMKIIDPEFAFYGPIGYDVGTVIGSLLLNFAGQEGWSADERERQDYRGYLLDTIRDLWSQFERQFRELWNKHTTDRMAKTQGYQDMYVARLLQDAVGFAGAITVCRVHGFIHVADIADIEDPNARERAQRLALKIGAAWIKRNRAARSIEEALEIARETAEEASPG